MTAERASALSRISRLIRDLCLVAIGIITLGTTPASLDRGLHGHLTTVWSLTLLIGGVVCLVGWSTYHPLTEVAGCLLAAVGLGTWAVAAITQPVVTSSSWAVALVLIAGVAGQAYRIAEVLHDARPLDMEAR